MNRSLEYTENISYTPVSAGCKTPFGPDTAARVLHFHKTVPGYAPTPLVELPGLARALGLYSLQIKDESKRFGLNAFKGLGGSWAVASCLAEKLGLSPDTLTFNELLKPENREKLGPMTFITTTDGNHGRGLAWFCHLLNYPCVVYLPKGSAQSRLEAISGLGARATVTEFNYDDAVRFSAAQAQENGWILVQDTSWPGYEKTPLAIMEGYSTLGLEAVTAWRGEAPTHVFLQAGVGAMAGSITGFLAAYYGENCPRIIILEPHAADPLYQTARAHDGSLHRVTGDLDSIMAGLCCGEVCPLGWEMISRYARGFVSVPDSVAEEGMRLLGKAPYGDPVIISGESGAGTTGLLARAAEDPALRQALGLNKASRVLLISTEGDTDPVMYRKIMGE